MDAQLNQISLYFEEQQIIIQSSLWVEEQILDIATHITNEIKKKHQTNELNFKDQEQQSFQLDQVVKQKLKNIYLSVPHAIDISTLSNTDIRSLIQIYTHDDTKVKLEKFKNKRKTETVVYELSTLQKFNNVYLETYVKFLKKNNELAELINEPNSPEFGASKVPLMKSAGNDGKSQSKMLKQAPKMTIELKPYTIQEVALHKTEQDAWTVHNGKIYDVTFYIRFHPGGKEKLMLGVGIDGTALFNQHHSWVNGHFLLEKYQVGFLVSRK